MLSALLYRQAIAGRNEDNYDFRIITILYINEIFIFSVSLDGYMKALLFL